MNIVYFYVLGFLEIATADDCGPAPNDCEAEEWTHWTSIEDCGEKNQKRSRVCSTWSGYCLALCCSDDDRKTHDEYRTSSPLIPCRKF